jgi:predicted transcriptional regulator
MKEEDIALEIRRMIYNYIKENPGSHLRKISRVMEVQMGTLRYHLDFLEKNELIRSKKEKNLKIYFITGELSSDDINITSLLQQKRFRDIILTIVLSSGMTHSEISEKLSMKLSTLSKYIKILEERHVIYHERKGRENHYYVTNERMIMKLLLTYKKSFWDKFVDNVLEIYFER